jgi:putative transposase
LTRYIHLNPTSAGLVTKPEDWSSSSYNDYINTANKELLKYSDLFSITPKDYKKFVMDHKDYQKELSKIKRIIIDDYTG